MTAVNSKQMEKMDDHTLVAKILKGDAKAWADFARRHGPQVHGAVEHIVTLLPEAFAVTLDVDALTVQVFASLLEDRRRRLRNVGANADIAGWLTLIARRLTLKQLRSSRDFRRISGDMEFLLLEEAPLREDLRDDFAELPARDQLILTLYFFEGIHPVRIAEHLRIEPAQVQSFLLSATEKLRQKLHSR